MLTGIDKAFATELCHCWKLKCRTGDIDSEEKCRSKCDNEEIKMRIVQTQN